MMIFQKEDEKKKKVDRNGSFHRVVVVVSVVVGAPPGTPRDVSRTHKVTHMKETKKTTTRQIENIYKTREEHYLEAIKK
jgi:hypothetical protein